MLSNSDSAGHRLTVKALAASAGKTPCERPVTGAATILDGHGSEMVRTIERRRATRIIQGRALLAAAEAGQHLEAVAEPLRR